MKRHAALSMLACCAVAPSLVSAQAMPAPPPLTPVKMSPIPTPAEAPFIAKIQHDIPARFPTVASAEKAGYFQYTPEDNTGAISYVNLKVWNSIDIDVPNQLWYDAKGRLLGVDYTELESQSPAAPATLFGYAIDPSRWIHRPAHIHWGFTAADGSLRLGGTSVAKLVAAGGVASADTPLLPVNRAALVQALANPDLTSPDQVKFAFLHPAMWDLIAWVLPNPNGAWADANPNVTPTPKKPAAM